MIKTMPPRRIGLLLAGGVFFSLAPWWAPHLQQVGGHNLFVTSDSLRFLGITLLLSLLGYYLLPDGLTAGRPIAEYRLPSPARRNYFMKTVSYGLLAIGAMVLLAYVLYWINQSVLHSFISSADEHSCYFLAECLRKGKLYVDIPPLADFFKVVHVGMKGGKWFSVYPPGWPLIWALGLEFKIVDWLNPVMSALAVFLFFLSGKRLFGLGPSIYGLLICVLSPFFMFTAASYFSHATCLLMISIFLYTFLRWREAYEAGRDPVLWAALCAGAVGYGLMTRYLTMAAVAGPFLLYHFWGCLENTGCCEKSPGAKRVFGWRLKLRRSDWIFLAVVSAFMALILWQNYLVTGKPFKAPNKYDKSWERLGFRGDYTPVDALFFQIARTFYLMDWFAPAFVAAYLFFIFRKGEYTPLQQLFRRCPVLIAAAYFFYYSWGGNQWGPRYWWEGMPFLAITVAAALGNVWRSGEARARKFILVFVIASLASSGLLFAKHAKFTEEASRQRRALYDLAERTIQGPAVVFIRGFLGSRLVLAEEDAVRNSPFLNGPILYAHDLGDRNEELMQAYPGRTYYRGSYDRGLQRPVLERLG